MEFWISYVYVSLCDVRVRKYIYTRTSYMHYYELLDHFNAYIFLSVSFKCAIHSPLFIWHKNL